MPFANGIDITSLIERIPVAGTAAKPLTENQMVRMLTKLIKDMTRFEAKVESGEKATLNLKVNGQTLKLSFDPNKDSPVESVEFVLGGMTFSPSDIDPQELAATARAALRGAAPEGQARELVDAVFGLVESVSGSLSAVDPVTAIQGLTGGLGLDTLPTALTGMIGGLASDPTGVLTDAVNNLAGGNLNGNPTSGNPAGPVLNPAADPALGMVGETGGNNTAPALDAFNVINGGPADFLFAVASNTSTFNTGTDHTTPVRDGAQGGAPSLPGLPTAPGVPAVPALPGLPAAPGVPSLPGVPVLPGAPAVPTLPGLGDVMPSLPGVPGAPTIPTLPGAPTVPTLPGVPALPGVPSLPAAPDLGAITGIVGSLPVAGLFGLFG